MRLATVVCRPMSSASRTAPVSKASLPRRAFSSVDLPAPDSPSTIATCPLGTSALTASRPQATPSSPASTRMRSSSAPSAALDVSASGLVSPKISRTAATSRRKTSSPARSALVSTTATSAPQSRAMTAERAMRSHETSRSPSCCTTSTTSTLAASVCFSPRALPFQRAMSLSRGRISSINPMSWPSGRRAHTQSPTAAREFSCRERPPFVSRAENSARKTPSAHRMAGKPRSRRTTQPISSSPVTSVPAASQARAAAASNAATWASLAKSSSKAGKSVNDESAGSSASPASSLAPRLRPFF